MGNATFCWWLDEKIDTSHKPVRMKLKFISYTILSFTYHAHSLSCCCHCQRLSVEISAAFISWSHQSTLIFSISDSGYRSLSLSPSLATFSLFTLLWFLSLHFPISTQCLQIQQFIINFCLSAATESSANTTTCALTLWGGLSWPLEHKISPQSLNTSDFLARLIYHICRHFHQYIKYSNIKLIL